MTSCVFYIDFALFDSRKREKEVIKKPIPFYLPYILALTEVAGEGGTDCLPQKFLSSQKFRHLMG